MAHYRAWNSAITQYFTAGAPKGSHIFLSLDDEAVEEISMRFLDEEIRNDTLQDFISAVREICVTANRSLNLKPFRTNIDGIPNGIGFLGAMVLAAYRMQGEEEVDQTNYFIRFREVMQLPADQGGRPEGMPPGAEEPLWIEWNKYLINSGFLTTAERGSGPQTNLRYVFSQAILRESDKQYLTQLYNEKNLPRHFDCNQLGFWLSNQQISRRHLKEGLAHIDPAHVWEFCKAAYRIYETDDWITGNVRVRRPNILRQRNIECGLYHVEEISGDSDYFLFPKQPERSPFSELLVSKQDGTERRTLQPLRPGFFCPLWSQFPFVENPIQYEILNDKYFQKITFPKRDFWILTTDPETPLGAYATWKPYLDLGEKLLVLCRKGEYADQMTLLSDANLIRWRSQKDQGDWIEYYDCMVLSYDWGGFISNPDCQDLVDAFTPRAAAGVSLFGGLRDSNQNAWLEGYPPGIKIYGFEKKFDVIIRSADGSEVFNDDVLCQQEYKLPVDLYPDVYQVEVKWNERRLAMRMFRIIDWEYIQEHPSPEKIVNDQPISTGGLRLHGPLVFDPQKDKDNREVQDV